MLLFYMDTFIYTDFYFLFINDLNYRLVGFCFQLDITALLSFIVFLSF